MDFSFSEEQEMLRAQARSLLEQRLPSDRVVELAESEQPFDPALWKEMASLGWTSLSIPEESGGSGMTFLDEAVLFEELGRALYPGPYFSTIALALPALAGSSETLAAVAAGDEIVTLAWAEPDGRARLDEVDGLATRAAESDGTWTLDGVKELVPDAAIAKHVVVSAGTDDGAGLWLVDLTGEGVMVTPRATVDSTRRLATVELRSARATLLAAPPEAARVGTRTSLRASAAAALESVGVAQKALELAQEHAKTRQQFDKPIGSYQAVSHQVADTYVDVELARSLAYWAAWCVAEDDDQAPIAVAAAKSAAGEAAVTACERSIQVHGGIGFTWEHILHRYYKRALSLGSFDGFAHTRRAQIAARLLDG